MISLKQRGVVYGIMGDRYINNGNGNGDGNSNNNDNGTNNSNMSIRYIDANNLYGYAMMQKLP